jgi:hypothetical protein
MEFSSFTLGEKDIDNEMECVMHHFMIAVILPN